jgi:hypothetical protein
LIYIAFLIIPNCHRTTSPLRKNPVARIAVARAQCWRAPTATDPLRNNNSNAVPINNERLASSHSPWNHAALTAAIVPTEIAIVIESLSADEVCVRRTLIFLINDA